MNDAFALVVAKKKNQGGELPPQEILKLKIFEEVIADDKKEIGRDKLNETMVRHVGAEMFGDGLSGSDASEDEDEEMEKDTKEGTTTAKDTAETTTAHTQPTPEIDSENENADDNKEAETAVEQTASVPEAESDFEIHDDIVQLDSKTLKDMLKIPSTVLDGYPAASDDEDQKRYAQEFAKFDFFSESDNSILDFISEYEVGLNRMLDCVELCRCCRFFEYRITTNLPRPRRRPTKTLLDATHDLRNHSHPTRNRQRRRNQKPHVHLPRPDLAHHKHRHQTRPAARPHH